MLSTRDRRSDGFRPRGPRCRVAHAPADQVVRHFPGVGAAVVFGYGVNAPSDRKAYSVPSVAGGPSSSPRSRRPSRLAVSLVIGRGFIGPMDSVLEPLACINWSRPTGRTWRRFSRKPESPSRTSRPRSGRRLSQDFISYSSATRPVPGLHPF